jgi:leucyl-tRNA synthetase
MHKKFDNIAIEKKWQERWEEKGLYTVGERDETKEKEYVLVELPYPSGNLHIGHWHAFAVPDIYVRFKRMHGKQVVYPMGFDAFGLPAENAAIKRNIDPREWTESNIAYMKEQLRSMGAAFSWDKTASTIDPTYYKWTQWMFTEFFKKGIAYRGRGIVNWCPGCNTVIANEQVLSNGTCERSGDMIEKREMPQWMLRITDYADRLVDDLEGLDWPEPIKEAQRRWIGRSKGAEIDFQLSCGEAVTVFTTRPDTLYGATYLVLAPEHELIRKYSSQIQNFTEVEEYIKAAAQKDEQDRLDATKEKTGVKLEGMTAFNPANGKEIPVFVADYVLGGYGTGAIMAVPAHDERDFEFAEKYDIAITQVIAGDGALPFASGGELINSAEFNGMSSQEAKEKIVEKVAGKMANTYRLRDWSVGRQRYWGVPIPIVYDPQGEPHAIPEEHLPWTLPEDVDFRPTGVPPLQKSEELKKRTEAIFGEGWTPEVETLDTFVDSSWYFLRYIDNENQNSFASLEAQKEWMPIDMYFGGAEHTTMHLLYSRFWQKALYDLGYVTENEPYKRRINRGLVLGPDGNKMSKSKGNVIDPDDHVKNVGADSVKMYLAFMGPYAETANYPWDMGGIAGIRRFLERVNGLSEHIKDSESAEMTKHLHKTIAKVYEDVPQFKFNTAISALMVYINAAEKEGVSSASYEVFLKLLAPFAAHLTEELWEKQGHSDSIHKEAYPQADPALLLETEKTLAVQFNGKMRGSLTVRAEATEEEVVAEICKDAHLSKYLSGEIRKVIFVPGKIINLIIGN